MFEKLYEQIFFISAFLYLLFAIFLFSHKKGNRLSNKIFAGFCLANAFFIMIDIFDIFCHSLYKIFPLYFDVIWDSCFFLIGPLLFFYTMSLINRDFAFKKIHLWHLLPFFIDLIYRNYRFFAHENIEAALTERGFFIPYWELRTRYITMDFHVIVYALTSLIIFYMYRSRLKEIFSSVEKIKLSWLHLVLYGFMAIHLLHISKITLPFLPGTWREIIGVLMHLGNLVLVSIVVFKGLKVPEIFSGWEEKPTGQKYAKTALSQEQIDQYKKKLTHYMEIDKPFLNPDLSITELADKLSVPSHYISQVLSQGLHLNFYHFVNRYRVEESKRILAEKGDEKTVLEILYETGFNSKSTFNRIFKQYTGVNPTEFIKSKNQN